MTKKQRETTRRLESLTAWLRSEGVTDEQTAWELAGDLEPVLTRLIDADRDVITK